MSNIFHFVEISDDDIRKGYSKFSSYNSINYRSSIKDIKNNIITIIDKKDNIILEKNIFDIDISPLDDELKKHIRIILEHIEKGDV